MISESRPEPSSDDSGGQGVVVLSDAGHTRADARIAARLISLGVVDEQRVSELLRKGFDLAEKSADRGDARGYSACMKIAIEAVKLEQKERENANPQTVYHEHGGTVGIGIVREQLLDEPEYLEYIRQRTLETDGNPGAVCEAREPGKVEASPPPDDAGPGHNGHTNGNGRH